MEEGDTEPAFYRASVCHTLADVECDREPQMHHVSKVAVEGFWETYDFELNLFPEVTFLIGPNGTGKTTLINLIAAALTADFRNLDKIPFRKLTITLNQINNGDKPRIIVEKVNNKSQLFESISYKIKDGKKGSKEIDYSLGDVEGQVLLRRYMIEGRPHRERYLSAKSNDLVEKIKSIVTVNWLSVHRTPSVERTREERSYESAVDQRLEALSNDLVRFFSTLSRRKDDEVRLFQESMFISLIEGQNESALWNTEHLNNVPHFVASLESIFNELHVSQPAISKQLDLFEKAGEDIERRLNSPEGSAQRNLHGNDLAFLLNLRRVSVVVDRWGNLQEKLADIFAPRDKWLKIANELFQRKKMELTPSNELQFVSRTGKILTPQMLSSGEKQLLILLSETLLQREQPAIFIADEPELSLHVLWQEKLVASLRALNPAAQIVAATHSPDIVGLMSDHAIDMETIIP